MARERMPGMDMEKIHKTCRDLQAKVEARTEAVLASGRPTVVLFPDGNGWNAGVVLRLHIAQTPVDALESLGRELDALGGA